MERFAIACIGALALAVGPAAAQARWTAPTQLAHRVDAVAGNRHGAQALLWQIRTSKDVVLNGGSSALGGYVQARVRRPDGHLTPAETLTRTDGASSALGIGLDARGTATALMTQAAGGDVRVVVSVRPHDGRFGGLIEVGRGGDAVGSVQLAVAPNGAAVIAWSDGSRVRAVRRPAGRCPRLSPRACFGPVDDIGGRCPTALSYCIDVIGSLAVTIAPGGGAAVAWTALQRNGTPHYATVIRFARSRGIHGFAAASTISHGSEQSVEPALAALHDGRFVAAWSEIPTQYSARIMTAILNAEGRLSERRTVSGRGCHEPRATVGDDDMVTLAWRCRARAYDVRRIFLAMRPLGGQFGPQLAIAPGDALDPLVIVDAHQATFVFYSTSDDGIHVRIRPPGQQLGIDRRVAAGVAPHVVAAGKRVTIFIVLANGSSTMRDWISESDPLRNRQS